MLHQLEGLKEPIRVGVVGAGAMGRGLVHQLRITPGLRCVAVCDLDLQKALACAEENGRAFEVVHDAEALASALTRGLLAVTDRGDLVADAERMDVLIESSSAIVAGGEFALRALSRGTHTIMMNSEADLAFGPYLRKVALEHRAVYSSCDGDQHGVLARLIRNIALWGFELILAGNIKGFLDRYADPTSIRPEADKRDLDYRMATAYTDGTKLSIEMALLANALGLRTPRPGMTGPRACSVTEALDLFDLPAIRDSGRPVVDYLLGAEPSGGVFAIGYSADTYRRKMMSYYKMGPGPFYLFYRPYHLCHLEAMAGIGEAVLQGRSLLEPTQGFRTDVVAYAKRDLRAGEVLDGLGGYMTYGMIENLPTSGRGDGLPICLGEGARLRVDIRKDHRVRFDDVSFEAENRALALHALALAASGRSAT